MSLLSLSDCQGSTSYSVPSTLSASPTILSANKDVLCPHNVLGTVVARVRQNAHLPVPE